MNQGQFIKIEQMDAFMMHKAVPSNSPNLPVENVPNSLQVLS